MFYSCLDEITKWPRRSHFTSLPITQAAENLIPPPSVSEAQFMNTYKTPQNTGESIPEKYCYSCSECKTVPEKLQVEQSKDQVTKSLWKFLLEFPSQSVVYYVVCIRVHVFLFILIYTSASHRSHTAVWVRSYQPYQMLFSVLLQLWVGAPSGSSDQWSYLTKRVWWSIFDKSVRHSNAMVFSLEVLC